METVLVVLPLPSPYLSPNKPTSSMGGRMRKASIAKKYRRLAKEAAKEEGIEETWQKATIQATFYHKQKRNRDDINHMAMLKSAYDGIVDSGLLEDDSSEHLTTLPATFKIDKKFPRVELLIERVK